MLRVTCYVLRDNVQNIIGTGVALKEVGHSWVEDESKYHCLQWVTTGTPVSHILFNNRFISHLLNPKP